MNNIVELSDKEVNNLFKIITNKDEDGYGQDELILDYGYINELLLDRYNKGKEEGIEKYNEANEFIKSIAKLLGEDDLGYDGKSWSIEDFENAIINLTPNQ